MEASKPMLCHAERSLDELVCPAVSIVVANLSIICRSGNRGQQMPVSPKSVNERLINTRRPIHFSISICDGNSYEPTVTK